MLPRSSLAGSAAPAAVGGGPATTGGPFDLGSQPTPVSPPQNPQAAPPPNTANTCAHAELTITRTIPTVWLLIDGSGSMDADLSGIGLGLGGPSRWSLLRQALLDPGSGLVPRLQGSVSFGLMIYDGGLSPTGVHIPDVCPRLVVVDPALNNATAIDGAYPAGPLGASTPTHYALEELSEHIERSGPSPSGPTYVVLATDGKPNLCDFHDGIPADAATEQEAVDTVAALSQRGTKLFAISMAGSDRALQNHLEAVAKAGSTGQPAFDPDSKDALAAALSTIVGGTATCQARIEGSIVAGRECAGDVRLGDTRLDCNSPNGFRVDLDGKSLELLGAACRTLQEDPNARLKATFACEDVILN